MFIVCGLFLTIPLGPNDTIDVFFTILGFTYMCIGCFAPTREKNNGS